MKTIPVSGPSCQKRDAMLKFIRAHPVWTSFVFFFYMVGVMHTIDDLGHFAFGWSSNPGNAYSTAAIFVLTMALVSPILVKEISPEQRKAEKKILDAAEEIVLRARGEAK